MLPLATSSESFPLESYLKFLKATEHLLNPSSEEKKTATGCSIFIFTTEKKHERWQIRLRGIKQDRKSVV